MYKILMKQDLGPEVHLFKIAAPAVPGRLSQVSLLLELMKRVSVFH